MFFKKNNDYVIGETYPLLEIEKDTDSVDQGYRQTFITTEMERDDKGFFSAELRDPTVEKI